MALIGIACVLGGHLCLTKSDIGAGFRAFCEWLEEQRRLERSEQWLQQRLQHKADLLEKCTHTILNMNKACVQFAALFLCASVWMISEETNIRSVVSLLALVVYLVHALLSQVRMTIDRIHLFSVASAFAITLSVVSILNETNLEHVLCSEKFCAIGLIFSAESFLDLKLLLPVHLFSAVAFSYKHWQIIGFENVTPMIVYATLAWHGGLVITTVFVVRTMENCVAAKRESNDASSLMLGFQKVLRGVCDGDVVLQRSSCTIVEDAACLERILKSNKKLRNTNFLDLFLDLESRNAFLNFLSAGADTAALAMIPRGLRVSLQGANGPVSVDLFHTRIPRDSVAGGDYSFLTL